MLGGSPLADMVPSKQASTRELWIRRVLVRAHRLRCGDEPRTGNQRPRRVLAPRRARSREGQRATVDGALTEADLAAMRFVLIPTSDSALNVLDHIPQLGPAQALERTLRTCDLLLTYALAIAGKPSMQ